VALVAAIIASAITVIDETPAQASNWSGASGTTGCSSGQNMADNREHTFFYNGIESYTRAAVDWSRANNFDPTEINTSNTVLDSLTDVVIFDNDMEGEVCGATWLSTYGGNGDFWVGAAFCQSLSGSACQQRYVYFDTDFMGPRSNAAEQWLACHEIGHTVGLGHYTAFDGCMQTPQSTRNYLHDHDRVHLHNYL
jgi:hypothetical protein